MGHIKRRDRRAAREAKRGEGMAFLAFQVPGVRAGGCGGGFGGRQRREGQVDGDACDQKGVRNSGKRATGG